MTIIRITIILIFVSLSSFAQDKPFPDTSYTFNHYKIKRTAYEGLPDGKREVIFLGNSITEHGEWNELFKNKYIINRGIGGDIAWGVYDRLDEVLSSKPKKIFLLIGINDIGRYIPNRMIADKIEQILDKITNESPKTKLYLQTILPINEKMIWYDYMKNKSEQIVILNKKIKALAISRNIKLIDLYKHFVNKDGDLPKKYTWDGLHLSSAGYLHWRDLIKDLGYL